MKYSIIPILAGILSASVLSAQTGLTVDFIMRDAKWMGVSPSNIQWDQNSRQVYFNWNPDAEPLDQLYQAGPAFQKPAKAADSAKLIISRNNLVYSADRTKLLYEQSGDIFISHLNTGKTILLVMTAEKKSNPVFTRNEKSVVFQQGDNLFSVGLTDGSITQLTNFSRQRPTSSKADAMQDQWLKNDQQQLFETLRKQEAANSLAKRSKPALQSNTAGYKLPKPVVLDEGTTVGNVVVSPDENFVVYRLAKQPAVSRPIIVPNYVSGSGYTEDIPGRTKVGSVLPISESWIYDRARDTAYSLSTAGLEGIRDLPAFLAEYPEAYQKKLAENKDRPVTIGQPVWSPDGKSAVVSILSADNKDRWIMLLNCNDAKLTLLDHQRDTAWIGGPGIAGPAGALNLNWIDYNTVYFQSEATGYSHIYTVNVSTGDRKQITKGSYEIQTLKLSNDRKHFYFTANMEHPGLTDFYRIPVQGGQHTKLTTMRGGNEVSISPDEKWLAIRYSYTTKPWELYLQENKAGAKPVQITNSTTGAFRSYPWKEPEMIVFKNRHGADVYAQIMRTAKPDPKKPAVVFVHSNGYLQNVHYMWSYHFREYMFNNMLVDKGYTVINIDYNASSGYGRATRTGIYRHMGGRDLSDLTDGVKLLVERYDVNPSNIGIYGGSYGGFLTLMAMFTEPNVYKSGAALRSVTDWAHYNQRYTSNILNEPISDEKSYKKSSPIYFADGLKGNLLMTHGIVDVNVNFQDIVRLTQKLIELGKHNWDLAVYPLEDHNFVEPSAWTDQYHRILDLFEKTLKQ